jgi:CheY-like chemotaxis protein
VLRLHFYESIVNTHHTYHTEVERANILIVEDEMITALDIRNQLRRLGYQVSALAKSGDEAVRLSSELNPDLILMDVNLAGPMNGIEASRRIQETKRVPVVYLTAYPDVFVRTPSKMQHPYLCLAKPLSVPDLQAVIDIALERERPQPASWHRPKL